MFIWYVLIENRHSVKNPSVEVCFRDSLLYCQVTKYINPPLVLRIFMEKKKTTNIWDNCISSYIYWNAWCRKVGNILNYHFSSCVYIGLINWYFYKIKLHSREKYSSNWFYRCFNWISSGVGCKKLNWLVILMH